MYGIIDAAIAAQPSPATCGGAEGGASNKARKVGLVLAPDNRSAGKAHTCTHTQRNCGQRQGSTWHPLTSII